ncbi:hypothetical protein LLG07_01165 [bacterium]|nr:hypothetical protein [bacterium]
MNDIKNNDSDGEKIIKAMTSIQLAKLIDMLLSMLDEKSIKSLFEDADNDFSEILFNILNKNKMSPISKNSKYNIEWEILWAKLSDIISELGDESGDYIIQDHDWETPYFSEYDFTEDLEKIAEKLFAIINSIETLDNKDWDLFLDMLRNIEDGIKEYPEWIGADYSDCVLGVFTTKCILKWEWLAANSNKNAVWVFIKRIDAADSILKVISLDTATFINFFTSFEENIQKQIYEILKTSKEDTIWQKRLKDSGSKWHRLYLIFASLFDFDEYLENCLKYLYDNWKYGLPLIENLLKQQDYVKAEKIIKKTFKSLLRQPGNNEAWLPEKTILIDHNHYLVNETDKDIIIGLLQDWILISEKTNNNKRKLMLSAQVEMYKNPCQLDSVVRIFNKLLQSEYQDDARMLFNKWQNFIIKDTIGSNIFNHKEIYDSWINWLIETEVDDMKDESWFFDKVKDWLQSVTNNQSWFKKFYNYILVLTGDLFYISSAGEKYPVLFSIIKNNWSDRSDSTISRCKWLKKLSADKILPDVMKCWENNIADLVQDPSKAYKSDYTDNARWLSAVHEVNPGACEKIIYQWKIDHKSRRNLWKSVTEAGLSGYLH